MKKQNNKAELSTEEKKTMITELRDQTRKDDNERGVLIGGSKKITIKGNNDQLDDKDWNKARWKMQDNPKTDFDLYHTHSEWDCPLSNDDIATFLYLRNMHSMSAITEEHVYTITRTEKTPVIDYADRKDVKIKYRKYAEEMIASLEIVNTSFFYFEETRRMLCDVTQKLADEYGFIYEESQ